MDNKLFEKINSLSKDTLTQETKKAVMSNSNLGRKMKEEVLRFEIRDTDSELVVFIKNIINSENMTNKELYEHFGKSLGYNMIYSLTKEKSAIAWDRVRAWLDFLGYDVELVLKKREE